jgi:hypothetical protein
MIEMNYNFNTKLAFENGLTISFSIGEGNYCSNRNPKENPYSSQKTGRTSKNCEVLVFRTNSNEDLDIKQFLPDGQSNDGTYAGWVDPDTLAKIINNVANWRA